jgi:pimeloyl-ACP methyl ester carboxylesterase
LTRLSASILSGKHRSRAEFKTNVSSLILIALVLGILALDVLVRMLVLRLAVPIFESRPLLGAELYPPDPSAESFTIRTRDGVDLAASLFRTGRGAPRGLVLFCHELDSNRWSAPAYCEGLLAAGFHVLTFDFRNHGDSGRQSGYEPMHWPTEFEVEDARAALDWVETHADLRKLPLGAYGMSRGGAVALVLAAESSRVLCVAADGAYACMECLTHYALRWGRLYVPERVLEWIPRWHFNSSMWLVRTASEWRKGYRYARVSGAMSRLRNKPVLMISGERDNYVIPSMTYNLHARTGHAASGVWIVPEAKHNMARGADPAEYDRRLVEFFSFLDRSAWEAESSGLLSAANGKQPGSLSISPSGAPAV